MTTINNIEDLIRVLDERPEWLEAVRSRLLPRALLDLPEEFARFAAEARQFVEATDRRFATLETSLEALAESTGRRLTAIENNVGVLRNRMGDIRGRIVYDIVRDEAPLLAGSMGFQFSAILHRGDLQRLTQANDVSCHCERSAAISLLEMPFFW